MRRVKVLITDLTLIRDAHGLTMARPRPGPNFCFGPVLKFWLYIFRPILILKIYRKLCELILKIIIGIVLNNCQTVIFYTFNINI